MKITKLKNLSKSQHRQINQLWNEEYPVNLNNRFDLLLDGIENYNHYVIEQDNRILAWAVCFEKENEKRFSIIVHQDYKGIGLGKSLINQLKIEYGEFYGWVIDHNNDKKQNGEFYQSPINFYLKNGFEIIPNEIIDNETIKAVKIRMKIQHFKETERFVLREILPTDVEGLFELDSDPEVHRYLGNNPVKSIDEVNELIQFIRKQYIDNGIGRWAIIDKNTNQFIGWTGLKYVTEPINGKKNYYDLGYRIIRKYWGKGIASETAIAMLDYAFTNLKLYEIYAVADCENLVSNKILKKIGFQFVEKFGWEGIEHNWYQLTHKQYRE
jgi:[ribosomal protein S5]-alanine N-acetyltransferase